MFIKNIAPISSLFFAIAFLAIGYGMMITFVGVYLKESGYGDVAIGLINSAFFLGAIASSVFSQKIISTVGHIRSFSIFASLMVVSFLLHSMFLDEYFWALLRFLSGFSFYALLIIVESWLNEKSTSEQRGGVLAIYTIIFYLSTALGQLFLMIEGEFREDVFAFGSVLVLLSLIFIALTKIKEPIIKPFERYALPKLYSIAPLALTGSFIGGIFVGGFFTMLPLYLLEALGSVKSLSIFMAIAILGGLVSQYPIGRLSDIYGRRKLIAFSALFSASVSMFFLLIPSEESFLYSLGFLLGVGIFCLYPLSLARANDVFEDNKDVVEISRALLFSYGFGSFVAPLLIGVLFRFFGFDSFFWLYFFIGLFLMFYALSKKRVADDEMSVFVSVPMTAGDVMPEFDPRQEGS